jgi:hypothetical protein
VPQEYVFGAALSDSMTFNNKTFADLGVTPDSTHVWTWGTGLENQKLHASNRSRLRAGCRLNSFPGQFLFARTAVLRRKLRC